MGNTHFNFSMPPEKQYYVPVRTVRQPAHRKSGASLVGVAIVSTLGGILATAGVAFALLPSVVSAYVPEAFGDVPIASTSSSSNHQATALEDSNVKTVPAVATGDQVKSAKEPSTANTYKSLYPVHRIAGAAASETKAEAETEVKTDQVEPQSEENVTYQPDTRVWVEGWTELVVHPAVYDDIPNYESYLCSECGYESLDQSDIVAHMEEHDEGEYLTVDNDCPKVVLEEEWTETIKHEGHWE